MKYFTFIKQGDFKNETKYKYHRCYLVNNKLVNKILTVEFSNDGTTWTASTRSDAKTENKTIMSNTIGPFTTLVLAASASWKKQNSGTPASSLTMRVGYTLESDQEAIHYVNLTATNNYMENQSPSTQIKCFDCNYGSPQPTDNTVGTCEGQIIVSEKDTIYSMWVEIEFDIKPTGDTPFNWGLNIACI